MQDWAPLLPVCLPDLVTSVSQRLVVELLEQLYRLCNMNKEPGPPGSLL